MNLYALHGNVHLDNAVEFKEIPAEPLVLESDGA